MNIESKRSIQIGLIASIFGFGIGAFLAVNASDIDNQ